MNQYGYQQYKGQTVNSMTQGELLILVYDELIKRLLSAELAIEKGNTQLFDDSMDRAKEIVRYLTSTLDRRYEVSNDLYKMYDFFQFEFSRISAKQDSSIISEVKPLVVELRDAYREASKLA